MKSTSKHAFYRTYSSRKNFTVRPTRFNSSEFESRYTWQETAWRNHSIANKIARRFEIRTGWVLYWKIKPNSGAEFHVMIPGDSWCLASIPMDLDESMVDDVVLACVRRFVRRVKCKLAEMQFNISDTRKALTQPILADVTVADEFLDNILLGGDGRL